MYCAEVVHGERSEAKICKLRGPLLPGFVSRAYYRGDCRDGGEGQNGNKSQQGMQDGVCRRALCHREIKPKQVFIGAGNGSSLRGRLKKIDYANQEITDTH